MAFNHKAEQLFDSVETMTEEKKQVIIEAVQDILVRISTLPTPALSEIAEKIHKNIIAEERLSDEEKALAMAFLLNNLLIMAVNAIKAANENQNPQAA